MYDVAHSCLSPSLSLLPAIMQHRRTVSDTLLFRRPSVLEELKKDGPSSSHSSRSATPLLALLQPGGEGGIVGQPMVGQAAGSKVAGVVTSQHSPQQQKIAQREVLNTLFCCAFCMCVYVLYMYIHVYMYMYTNACVLYSLSLPSFSPPLLSSYPAHSHRFYSSRI